MGSSIIFRSYQRFWYSVFHTYISHILLSCEIKFSKSLQHSYYSWIARIFSFLCYFLSLACESSSFILFLFLVTYIPILFWIVLKIMHELDMIFQHLILQLLNCTLWLATDPEERLSIALEILTKEREVAKLQRDIAKQVEEKMAKSQREYFLREQLKSIKKVSSFVEIFVYVCFCVAVDKHLYYALSISETFLHERFAFKWIMGHLKENCLLLIFCPLIAFEY